MSTHLRPLLILLLLVCSSCERGTDQQSLQALEGIGEPMMAGANCLACHGASDAVEARVGLMPAPRLGDVGARMSPSAMRTFILDPHATKASTLMPSMLHWLRPKEREEVTENLVHYLQSLGGPFEGDSTEVLPSVPDRGRRLYETIGCVACHATDDAQRLARSTSVEELSAFLLDPLHVRPSGRMPDMQLNESEAHAIAAWLLRDQSNLASLEQSPGLIAEVYELDREIRRGDVSGLEVSDLFLSPNISLEDIEEDSMFAVRFRGSIDIPDDGIWSFLLSSDDGAWLWIDGELVIDNGGVHPVASTEGRIRLDAGRHDIEVVYFELGGYEELELEWLPPDAEDHEPIPDELFSSQLVTYVPSAEAFELDQDRVDMGEDLFVKFLCSSCHVPGLPTRATAFADLRPGEGCVAESLPMRVPDYGFDDKERAELNAVLQQSSELEQPLSPARLVAHSMHRLNCYACHVRDGVGGPDPSINVMFTSNADLGDEGRLPPDLTGVGNKLQETWIEEVLGGAAMRPYMTTRMPEFGPAVSHLPAQFTAADSLKGDARTPRFSVSDAEIGHQLVGIDGFKCVECHSFEGMPSLGVPGVDLVSTAERVRPGWFRAWMLDPKAMHPGTRMPSFFSSEQPIFPELLDGDAQRQIDALWSYFSLGASMPVPAGIVPEDGTYDLVPVDEPVLFGAFMEGVSPRTIAVGYPERTHIAWDSEHDRLALIWRGDFMNARGTWHQRAGELEWPDGTDVLEPPPGPAIWKLTSDTARWPAQSGTGVRILRDEARRPIFVTRQGDMEIAEEVRPELGEGGGRLHRTFTVTTSGHVGGIQHRAAIGEKIVDNGDGRWTIDDEVTIETMDARATVREIDGVSELLVPIRLRQAGDGTGNWTGTIKVEVIW